jgi:hypothetical protein
MSDNRVRDFWSIVRTSELPELGPGPRKDVLAVSALQAQLEAFFKKAGLSQDRRVRLGAAALLYHDHHDAAHDLVQDMTDADGALIHAILHRREPDYWNAKYWYRRIADHPIYRHLAAALTGLSANEVGQALATRLAVTGTVDPFVFVDSCEELARAESNDPQVAFLRSVQQAEFEALVSHLMT